jgi:hypothetical protein
VHLAILGNFIRRLKATYDRSVYEVSLDLSWKSLEADRTDTYDVPQIEGAQ